MKISKPCKNSFRKKSLYVTKKKWLKKLWKKIDINSIIPKITWEFYLPTSKTDFKQLKKSRKKLNKSNYVMLKKPRSNKNNSMIWWKKFKNKNNLQKNWILLENIMLEKFEKRMCKGIKSNNKNIEDKFIKERLGKTNKKSGNLLEKRKSWREFSWKDLKDLEFRHQLNNKWNLNSKEWIKLEIHIKAKTN